MTRELIVSLLIPYANYDVSYDTTNMEGLDETKALILLAIASNKQKNPTDKLKDVLHNFYHLNDNYDDFFIEELNNLIKNKTITNKVNDLASLDSYIGNFNIDSKIQSFLDDKSGFYGNSKNKQTHSLSLRIGLFTSQNYLEYNINDKNLVPYNEENGCAKFIDLNLTNNNKYNDAIVEYINNKKISENENLLDVNYKNEEEIKEATNLIYLKTDCKFKIDIDNNHFAKISYIEQLGERIYDNYYLRRTFYQNLLQLLCDQISFLQLENSSNVIPEINDLSDSLEFWEIKSSNDLKELFSLDHDTYMIFDNKLRKLFIYKQEVNDEINKAIWTKLYFYVLNDQEVKELINKNLDDNVNFVNKIYNKINNKEIQSFIFNNICSNEKTLKFYKDFVNNHFENCCSYIMNNQIDVEVVNELFKKHIDNYLIKQKSNNSETFLKLLKQKQIIDPDLQKKIINIFDFDYNKKQSFLIQSSLEKQIIEVVNGAEESINNANKYTKDHEKLENLYHELNNQIDYVNKLNNDLKLSCLKDLLKDLTNKKSEIQKELSNINLDSLHKKAQENRQIYEVKIPKLLDFKYDKSRGFKQVADHELVKKILNKNQQSYFQSSNQFNNKFAHGIENLDDYSNKDKCSRDLKKLEEYHEFLENLVNKIQQEINKKDK